MDRYPIFALVTALSFASIITASAAGENTGKNSPMAVEQKLMNPMGPSKSGLSMISGNISRIDTADPARIKIEVNGERDNQLHTIEITPSTSITKVTDASELKAGDAVRVMSRKTGDKEIATGIMFGNLKKLPAAVRETPKK